MKYASSVTVFTSTRHPQPVPSRGSQGHPGCCSPGLQSRVCPSWVKQSRSSAQQLIFNLPVAPWCGREACQEGVAVDWSTLSPHRQRRPGEGWPSSALDSAHALCWISPETEGHSTGCSDSGEHPHLLLNTVIRLSRAVDLFQPHLFMDRRVAKATLHFLE